LLDSFVRAGAGTGFIFLMTTLGAAAVFCLPPKPRPELQRVFLGFAAGVMTAAAVWSLLLPAIGHLAAAGRPLWVTPALGMAAGAVFLGALDAWMPRLCPGDGGEPARRDALLIAAITFHNIPEGMAVGLAFAMAADGEGLAAAAALALGIGIQNFPEGAAVALPLLEKGQSRRRAFCMGVLSGAVEPVFGLLAALTAAAAAPMMPALLSFAAGAMLYVVAQELVPQAHSRGGTFGFLLGFLFMMVLDVALG